MQWLLANWIWVLVGIAFIGMHIFGHGGHGSHGSHGRKKRSPDSGGAESDETPEPDIDRIAGGHRH